MSDPLLHQQLVLLQPFDLRLQGSHHGRHARLDDTIDELIDLFLDFDEAGP